MSSPPKIEHDKEDASLAIEDLRNRLFLRSDNEGAKTTREEIVPGEKWVLSREVRQYIIALVCGVFVALLVMSFIN